MTADDAAPDTPDQPTESDSAGSRRPALVMALATAVVVLAVLLVVTFLDRNDLRDDADRVDDIAAVAAEFGRVLYAYDYRDIEGQLRNIEDLATPNYAGEFRTDFEANLRAQIVEREVISSAEVHEVMVNQSEGDRAQAIVIATTTVEGPEGSSGTISTLVQLSLLRVDDEWLVDKVLTIANQPAITDADGQPITDASTSTTAPSTTAPEDDGEG